MTTTPTPPTTAPLLAGPATLIGDDGPQPLQVQEHADGSATLRFSAQPGLYQLGIVADASGFDWERLYIRLDEFGNGGARTGPWDFDLTNGNAPLVPAYRTTLNGRTIGPWFFQRVSLQDMAAKRFRGHAAFHITKAGEQTIHLEPMADTPVQWASVTLEPDPVDRLAPLPDALKPAEQASPWRRWRDSNYWQSVMAHLDGPASFYRQPVEDALDWPMSESRLKGKPAAEDLPALIAGYRLRGDNKALHHAMAVIDHFVDLPAWGNPNPDGYSHNGDMGASSALRFLAMALHMLTEEELGPDRRERVIEKLRYQGEVFFELALLNRDYWGGSIAQDHGYLSSYAFATAALSLVGILDEADRWLAWGLHRIDAQLRAMPEDGSFPMPNYASLWGYFGGLDYYRSALLAQVGDDLFAHPKWRPIPDYLAQVTDAKRGLMVRVTNQQDWQPLGGGEAALWQLASATGDKRFATMAHLLATTFPPDTPRPWNPDGHPHGRDVRVFHEGKLMGLLAHLDTSPLPKPDVDSFTPEGGKRMRWFTDAGFVHYRDDANGVMASLRCGAWPGYTAYRHCENPCDLLEGPPDAGHFNLAVNGIPLLASPEGGYSLRSELRNILMVDGHGQKGDVGYPMSISAGQWRGERVAAAHWDEKTGRGWCRLDLGPAYPDDLDLASYTRTLHFGDGREIVCRDQVLFDAPHQLAWLFHANRASKLRLDGDTRCLIGGDDTGHPQLAITPRTAPDANVAWHASVAQTRVIWSYASPNNWQPFDHVRYEMEGAVRAVTVEFLLTW